MNSKPKPAALGYYRVAGNVSSLPATRPSNGTGRVEINQTIATFLLQN